MSCDDLCGIAQEDGMPSEPPTTHPFRRLKTRQKEPVGPLWKHVQPHNMDGLHTRTGEQSPHHGKVSEGRIGGVSHKGHRECSKLGACPADALRALSTCFSVCVFKQNWTGWDGLMMSGHFQVMDLDWWYDK